MINQDSEDYYQNGIDCLNGTGSFFKNTFNAYKNFSRAADMGHLKAMHEVAISLIIGRGVEKNEKLGFDTARKCAELGNDAALMTVAICYEKGNGVSRNQKKALEIYNVLAEKNDSRGFSNSGRMYHYGKGVNVDYSRALQYYKKGAMLNDGECLWRLGLMYESGNGVIKSEAKAREYFEEAIKNHYTEASVELALLIRGQIELEIDNTDDSETDAVEIIKPEDIEKRDAVIGLLIYAAQKGCNRAISTLCQYLWDNIHSVKNTTDSDKIEFSNLFAKWIKIGADGNDIDCLGLLGNIYNGGFCDLIENSPEKSFECYKKIRDLGSGGWVIELAKCYYYGTGCKRDIIAAAKLFEEKTGNPPSKTALQYLVIIYDKFIPNDKRCFELANKLFTYYPGAVGFTDLKLCAYEGSAKLQHFIAMLVVNEAIKNDGYHFYKNDALSLLETSAQRGWPASKYDLGLIYLSGKIVPKNNLVSYQWFNLAAADGFADAAMKRDELALMMSKSQIAEAQKLSLEWVEDENHE